MIKAVIIGFSHMHVNEVALYISEHPDYILTGVADVKSNTEDIPALRYTPNWNLENVKNNYCSNVYDDYTVMLDELQPDIAFILAENCQKLSIVSECAERGVNVSIEKPMALNLNEAKQIKCIVDKYNIEAVVNWPVVWREYVLRMKNAIDNGIIGIPVKLRYINGHTGPLGKGAKHRGVDAKAEEMTDEQRGKTWWHKASSGGGIYLDISCYGCLFAKWMLGNGATSVISYGANLNTPYGDTEDNFAGVIKYADKMAIIEGTWTTPRAVIPSGPMVIGTEGVIMCTGGAENAPNVVAYDLYGNKIDIPQIDFPDKFKNMPYHYANHIATGEPIYKMLTLEINIEIMATMDALAKSSHSGKEECICD